MATLTMSVANRAMARLTVTGWQNGMSILRKVAGETQWVYPAWEPNPGVDRVGLDPGTPIDRETTWTIVDSVGATVAQSALRVPGLGNEWLVSLPDGRVSECWIESWPERSYPIDQNVMRPLDETFPTVASGTRQVATSKVTVFTLTVAQASAMRASMKSAAAILRTADPEGQGVYWVAIGSVSELRTSPLVAEASRRWDLEVTAVEPWAVPWGLTGANLWSDWMQETWEDWRAPVIADGRARTWRDVLSGDPNVRTP